MAGPLGEFGFRPRLPRPGEEIRVFAASTAPLGRGIAWRAWDFGDGTSAVGGAPTHRHEKSGCYIVTRTLARPDGRSSSVQYAVLVDD
jgi:PKD domain-containing protein